MIIAALALSALTLRPDFSGVVLLAKDGQPVMQRAQGLADPVKGIENRMDTKFNLGSINKIFTRVAIGQLAAAGKLSLDDTIRKHLPDYPSPAADRITIQQLLDQKSGLGDIFGPRYEAAPPSRLRKLSDYLPLFVDKPLEFEPGTSQRYSNAGYIVLGLIIEKRSGQSYYDYVRDHITKPAGMTDTASYAVDEQVPNRAIGQTKNGSNTATLPGRGSSAGGGYSTAADMLRFAQALLADKLLDHKWTDWVFGGSGERNLGVAGGAPGINAALEIAPPYTLVVLANQDPPAAEEVMRSARELMGGGARREMRRAGADAGPGRVLIGGRTEVPMTFSRHLPVIEAKINGKGPYRFTFDTGFGHMMQLSAAIVAELGLPQVGEARAGDPSGKNSRTMRMLRVDSIDIGDVHLGGVDIGERTAPALDGNDGVIGLPLFRTLLVTFDYPRSKFVIDGGSLPATALAYTTDRGGVPAIDIDVAGLKTKVDIDSGSPAEITLPMSMARTLKLAEEPKVVGHARTPSNEFDIWAAPLVGEVKIGDAVLTNPRLDIVEIFDHGHIGSRFLRNYAVTFDPANKRVVFYRPTSANSSSSLKGMDSTRVPGASSESPLVMSTTLGSSPGWVEARKCMTGSSLMGSRGARRIVS
ncbi:MAG TPA: serine hydrolase [Thermoanaerobaculia bacterium]|nr:serine hydrolase [Thermoanaerobaculia bacterium]